MNYQLLRTRTTPQMNYHATKPGPFPDALDQAVKHCAALAVNHGSNSFLVATHTLNQLESSVIEEVLTKPLVKELRKEKVADLDGFKIFLMTERISATEFSGGPALAPHISTDYLEDVMALNYVTDIVYVPWTPDELDNYVSTYDSKPL